MSVSILQTSFIIVCVHVFYLFNVICSEKLRLTQNAMSEADATSEATLGKEGEPFKFTQCVNKVTVEEAAVITNQITVIEDFIRNHAGH